MDESIGEVGVLGRGRPVEYVERFPANFEMSNIHLSLFMKLNHWKYEDEYRILAVNNDEMLYDETALVEVTFGCRMNQDFEPVVRAWVSQGHHQRVRFRRAKLSESGGLDFVDA